MIRELIDVGSPCNLSLVSSRWYKGISGNGTSQCQAALYTRASYVSPPQQQGNGGLGSGLNIFEHSMVVVMAWRSRLRLSLSTYMALRTRGLNSVRSTGQWVEQMGAMNGMC